MNINLSKDIGSYTFDASAHTITFIGVGTVNLQDVFLITNVTDNVIIFNFASAGRGGSILSNVLTLDYDTSLMDNTDELQIVFDVGFPYLDFGLGALRIVELSPLWNRYTDVETLVSAQNLTDVYVDYGAEIDMRGYTHLGIFVAVDANDSQDVYLKALGKHTESGTEEFSIDGVSEILLWSGTSTDFNKYYEFDIGVIPYIQLQSYATVPGSTVGDLTIYITKSFRP